MRVNGVGEYRKHGVSITISDPLDPSIDLDNIISRYRRLVPDHYIGFLDMIYIGDFPFLKERNLNALYKDQAFFITNQQEDEDDMLEDLVHETAHMLEEQYKMGIYSGGAIESEFLKKRQSLYLLLDEVLDEITVGYDKFLKPEYDIQFDTFLYRVVGYSTLAAVTVNLFYSPYGATSLREYFANGFEAFYYHRDTERLKKISPILYNRIVEMENESEHNV